MGRESTYFCFFCAVKYIFEKAKDQKIQSNHVLLFYLSLICLYCKVHSSTVHTRAGIELSTAQKGETINRMKEQTGAHIEMNKNSPHDAPTKQFFIKGTPEQIKAAKDEIAKIVGDGGSEWKLVK